MAPLSWDAKSSEQRSTLLKYFPPAMFWVVYASNLNIWFFRGSYRRCCAGPLLMICQIIRFKCWLFTPFLWAKKCECVRFYAFCNSAYSSLYSKNPRRNISQNWHNSLDPKSWIVMGSNKQTGTPDWNQLNFCDTSCLNQCHRCLLTLLSTTFEN